jgi:predicted transcriptional regulator
MRTKKRAPLLAPQELEIMKVVWQAPEVTVREVYEALRRRRKVAYTTVMTMMGVLERKGHLTRTAVGRTHVYRAAQPRRSAVSALIGDFVDRVFNGSARPLLLHLASDGRLSKDDVEELRRLLEESE